MRFGNAGRGFGFHTDVYSDCRHGVCGNFTFTTSDTLNGLGGYDIQNISGNVGTDMITSLLVNPTPGQTHASPDLKWGYDNVYYNNSSASFLDSDGIVFNTGSGAEYNFWSNPDKSYTLASVIHDASGQLVNGPRANGYAGNASPPSPPPPLVTHPSTSPTVLTFEGLMPAFEQLPPFSDPFVSTQGYQFVSSANCCNFVLSVGAPTPANGAQFLTYTQFATTMTAVDGSAFSVTSLDTENGQYQSGAHSIVVTGTYANGSQILQTLNVADAFQTYALTGFTDLTSLQFSSAGGNGYTSIDNIAATAVPEPATWSLLLLGFVGTGYALRRKRKVAVSVS